MTIKKVMMIILFSWINISQATIGVNVFMETPMKCPKTGQCADNQILVSDADPTKMNTDPVHWEHIETTQHMDGYWGDSVSGFYLSRSELADSFDKKNPYGDMKFSATDLGKIYSCWYTKGRHLCSTTFGKQTWGYLGCAKTIKDDTEKSRVYDRFTGIKKVTYIKDSDYKSLPGIEMEVGDYYDGNAFIPLHLITPGSAWSTNSCDWPTLERVNGLRVDYSQRGVW